MAGVGGVLIGDMLEVADVNHVNFLGLIYPDQHGKVQHPNLDSVSCLAPNYDWNAEGPGSVSKLYQRLRNRVTRYDPHIRAMADRAVRLLKEQGAERVWAILNSPAVIDLLYTIAPKIKCEIITQVWDDPVHLGHVRNLDRFTRSRTVNRFHELLQRSTRIGVICEEAREYYSQKVAGDYVIVRHGIELKDSRPNWISPAVGEFRIGLSGSMYAPKAWYALQQSLDLCDWKVNGRQVVLVVAGSKIQFESRCQAEARFYGWRNQEEVLQLMSECDCLYLPQSFEAVQEPLTQLSFPTKLSTYVATGRPILIHTPTYGSLHRFSVEQDFGVLCDSLDPKAVLQHVRRLSEDVEYAKSQAESTHRIATSVLTPCAFRTGVRQMLGLDDVA